MIFDVKFCLILSSVESKFSKFTTFSIHFLPFTNFDKDSKKIPLHFQVTARGKLIFVELSVLHVLHYNLFWSFELTPSKKKSRFVQLVQLRFKTPRDPFLFKRKSTNIVMLPSRWIIYFACFPFFTNFFIALLLQQKGTQFLF